MKHVFLILPEHRLILESIATEMGLADYTAFKLEQISHPDFDPEFNVLTDLRAVKRGFSPQEVKGLVAFFKKNIRMDVSRRGCLLTLKPLQTAYSMIFQKQTKGSSIGWKVCTTLEESVSWLKHPMPAEKLEIMLSNLKEMRNLEP